MATINVLRKVKGDSGWKLLPVRRVNDKLDWTHVLDGGVPLVATAGTFYLEWREGGRRVRRAVGTHPRDAKLALEAQTQVVSLRDKGMAVEDAPQIADRRPVAGRTIAEAIASFKQTAPLKYRQKSRAKYTNALDSFQKWSRKTHLSQLAREDVTDFMGYLVGVEKLDRSTAVDKGHVIHSVFKDQGADIRMKRGDWPKVTEQERDIYEHAQLEKLFAAATEDEFALFQTFLLTGFREQEVGFLAWDDFNARRGTLSVTVKQGIGFAPKNYEERTVPIPSSLTELLKAHRKRKGEDQVLVFPTSSHLAHQGRPGGQRDRHMLDRLKGLAMRAGLNCGRCEAVRNGKKVTCAEHPVCKRFGLHKFRHTYATTLLRDGVDLVSLQKLLGHSDMDSTRKYLKALEPEDLQAKIANSSLSTCVFTRPGQSAE